MWPTGHGLGSPGLMAVKIFICLSFIVLNDFFANMCVKKIVPHQPKASPHVTVPRFGMLVDNMQQQKSPQSWTALFRAFRSHRQPSAFLTKLFPSFFFGGGGGGNVWSLWDGSGSSTESCRHFFKHPELL